ncbi:3-oxoacyl-[acyl-carrier-protein] reductase [Calditrichota bacterium]
MDLKDKVAIITGSGRGIGKAIALKLAQHGANIVISDVDENTANQTVDEIKTTGVDVIMVKADVSKLDSANNLIGKTLEKFGKIDILVNNAGITRDNLVMRMSEEEWDSVIAVNLKGAYNCIRAATKTLLKQRSGRIVNIASVVGQMGNAGQANYAAAKSGIIGLTKSVAKEFASRGILVNAVAPGFIQTAMTEKLSDTAKESLQSLIPLGRLGQPEDVANIVYFLVSDLSNYTTGQVINVDGGMVM